jgi:hypothetical protein
LINGNTNLKKIRKSVKIKKNNLCVGCQWNAQNSNDNKTGISPNYITTLIPPHDVTATEIIIDHPTMKKIF